MPSPLPGFYEQELTKIFSIRLKNAFSQEEKEAEPASASHWSCPRHLGCRCWMHSLVHPQAERGSGTTGLGCQGNAWILASWFLLVQSHLLPIRLANPALNPQHRQESSASSAAPHQHPAPQNVQPRAAPPGSSCLQQAAWPAPGTPPAPSTPPPAPAATPAAVPHARAGGRGPAAGIARPSGCGPGVGFAEIMPEELQRSRLSHRCFNRRSEKVCEPRRPACLTVLWGTHRNSTHGF